MVTGRKEDVGAAKREILSAAEHFSQIRASRRNNNTNGSAGSLAPGPPSPNAPGQVTIQVRVPYRVVGLVVGPKGATIKRIQQQTRTYIVTPSRDKEPVFEVTGTPENVDKARQEIESHIALRTGGLVEANNGLGGGGGSVPPTPGPHGGNGGGGGGGSGGDCDNDFHSNGVESGFHDLNNDLISCTMYKPPSSNSAFTSYTNNSALNASNNLLSHHHHHQNHRTTDNSHHHHQHHHTTPNIFNFPTINNANHVNNGKISEYANGFSTNGFGMYDNGADHDTGMGSPGFDPAHISVWQDLGSGDSKIGSNGGPLLFNASQALSGSNSSTVMVGGVPQHHAGPHGSIRRSNSLSSSTTTPRLSPTLTDNSSSSNPPGSGGSPASGVLTPGSDHSTVRRIRSDPLSGGSSSSGSGTAGISAMTFAPLTNGVLSGIGGGGSNSAFSIVGAVSSSAGSLSTSSSSTSSSPTDSTGSAGLGSSRGGSSSRRHCLMCADGGVVAALVPCGHNLFCMECANHIVDKPESDRRCPVCQATPTQAIRIFS